MCTPQPSGPPGSLRLITPVGVETACPPELDDHDAVSGRFLASSRGRGREGAAPGVGRRTLMDFRVLVEDGSNSTPSSHETSAETAHLAVAGAQVTLCAEPVSRFVPNVG